MNEILEAYYVANELADNMGPTDINSDFSVFINSYSLYYQTIDILDKEILAKFYVKNRFANEILNQVLSEYRCRIEVHNEGTYSKFVLCFTNHQDLVDHLISLPRKFKGWDTRNSKRIADELGVEESEVLCLLNQ